MRAGGHALKSTQHSGYGLHTCSDDHVLVKSTTCSICGALVLFTWGSVSKRMHKKNVRSARQEGEKACGHGIVIR